jgi:uncharacterized OB-fold protein
MTAGRSGTVQSHTIIRVPGHAHAAAAPFVLLLVTLDDGTRLLGHFHGEAPPPIGCRVVASATDSETPTFSRAEENE